MAQTWDRGLTPQWVARRFALRDPSGTELWSVATQVHGEAELLNLKDVHWRAHTVLDALHRRDRKIRDADHRPVREEGFEGRCWFAPLGHARQGAVGFSRESCHFVGSNLE